MKAFLLRYLFPAIVTAYAVAILLLHAFHLFPRAGLYDISRLVGATRLTLEGRVLNFPTTRWSRTRFWIEARAVPMTAFQGRVAVGLSFPAWELAPGDRVRVRGWLYAPRPAPQARGFDERGYWQSRQTYAMMRVWSPFSFEILNPANRYVPAFWAWRFHRRFTDFWFEVLAPDEASLINAISLGSRGMLPARIKNACIRAGVYHIVVVSGQKIALIVSVGLLLLRLLRVPRRRIFWIAAPLIVFYALAVGADPPVTRASIMAIVLLGVMALGRDVPRYYPLFLAAGWILIREPEALLGASFQLSFAATASILMFFPFIQSRLSTPKRWRRWMMEAGGMAIAVHLGTWPFLVGYFHQLSLIGFIANWTVFPFSGVLMIYGLVVGTWGVLAPHSLPERLVEGMSVLARFTLRVIDWMGGGRFAAVPISVPGWPVCVVYYGILFCILFLTYRRKYGQTQLPDPARRHRLQP